MDMPRATASACICYVSDQGYLFPSLISALQARRNITPGLADVIMVYVGEETPISALFRSIYQGLGLRFITVSPATIENMHIMYGRLFLDRILDRSYFRILYIDGDTQIDACLDPLINVQLPSGALCAARDPMALSIEWNDRTASGQRTYFKSIGLDPGHVRNYFNSGIIRVDRDAWRDISVDTLKLVKSRAAQFRFPDQDALNLVSANRYLTMSFKWNFPVFLLNAGLDDVVLPRIYHFMSNPRPWHGPFQPWGKKWHASYIDLLKRYPELKPYMPTLSQPRYLKYFLQQHYKKRVESVVWKCPEIFDRVSEIERRSFV